MPVQCTHTASPPHTLPPEGLESQRAKTGTSQGSCQHLPTRFHPPFSHSGWCLCRATKGLSQDEALCSRSSRKILKPQNMATLTSILQTLQRAMMTVHVIIKLSANINTFLEASNFACYSLKVVPSTRLFLLKSTEWNKSYFSCFP